MTCDTLARLDDLLRTADPPDLVGRGSHRTYDADPALRERTLARAIAAHLAERRGWHAEATGPATVTRHLRVVGR